jgi:hypothetical protein
MWGTNNTLTQIDNYVEGGPVNTGRRWMNGKQIWEYAFHTTAPSNNATAGAVSGPINNVDEVISLRGTLDTADANNFPINYYNPTNNVKIWTWYAKGTGSPGGSSSNNNAINLGWDRGNVSNDSFFAGRPVRIIMEYTRTDATP